jgi:hypothetical protein
MKNWVDLIAPVFLPYFFPITLCWLEIAKMNLLRVPWIGIVWHAWTRILLRDCVFVVRLFQISYTSNKLRPQQKNKVLSVAERKPRRTLYPRQNSSISRVKARAICSFVSLGFIYTHAYGHARSHTSVRDWGCVLVVRLFQISYTC